ncbi:hypothetical protein PPMP20_27855 [Paraburkholderia phymatum]|nr:hypothetical protein [Paraburkholderia phymatum]
MKRIAAFCLTTWSAAALLYFGQHSVALIAVSGERRARVRRI